MNTVLEPLADVPLLMALNSFVRVRSYWLAPDGVSLAAVAGKLAAAGADVADVGAAAALSLAALPALVLLRLHPAMTQRLADNAAIAAAFNMMDNFMVRSLSCPGR